MNSHPGKHPEQPGPYSNNKGTIILSLIMLYFYSKNILFRIVYFKHRTEITHSHKVRTHKSHDLIISLITGYDILRVITNNKCRKIQSWLANNIQRTIWISGLRIPLQFLQNFVLLSWNNYKTSVSILTAKHSLSFRVAVKFCVRAPSPDYTTRFGSWLKGMSSWKLGGPTLFFRLRPRDINLCVLHPILKSL